MTGLCSEGELGVPLSQFEDISLEGPDVLVHGAEHLDLVLVHLDAKDVNVLPDPAGVGALGDHNQPKNLDEHVQEESN